MKAADTKSHSERGSARARLLKVFGFGAPARAALPEGQRIYAIGDIHGRADLLDQMHALIAEDAASYGGTKEIIYLGDFIDRGRDSKGVVERVLKQVPTGLKPRYIKGNHDAALLAFLADAETYRIWKNFGAAETLLSYGVRPPLYDSAGQIQDARDDLAAVLPADHLAFFNDLELIVVIGDYAFVHAGVRPGVAIEKQDEQDLLWIRDEFLSSSASFGKVVVHGHTPMPAPMRTQNRISVDTGAYATGVLTCTVLEGETARFLQARVEPRRH
jgi:serine/threonine protein phosphatase 1